LTWTIGDKARWRDGETARRQSNGGGPDRPAPVALRADALLRRQAELQRHQ
jgi:hypothetical protein